MKPVLRLAVASIALAASVGAADQHIFPGDSVPATSLSARDERGVVEYHVKSVVHPTGTIKVLTFTRAAGGVLHPIGDETELYVLEGTATVGVGGVPTAVKAGDAVSRPDGVLRGDGDARIIAWTVGSAVAAPTPMVVRAEDVTGQMTAEWNEGGKVIRTATTAETEAKAPLDAKRLFSRRYNFDGNSIRVAKLLKGGSRAPAKMTADSLIYVTGGPLRFRQGDEVAVVNAGDFIREEAGMTHVWDQLEDGGFITTTGIAPGK